MLVEQWGSLYLLISCLICSYFLVPVTLSKRSLTFIYLLSALVTFIINQIFTLFSLTSVLPIWLDFLAITLSICGLLALIRESKPVFARFPVYLTGIPLITIIFIPLSAGIEVINKLIMTTFQGGVLLVGVLIFGTKVLRNKNEYYQLSGFLLLFVTYLLNLFIDQDFYLRTFLNKMILGFGLILIGYGFYNSLKKE